VSLSPTPTAIPRDPGFTVDADPRGQRDEFRALAADVIRHAVADYTHACPKKPSRQHRWRDQFDSAQQFLFGPPSESTFELMAAWLNLEPEMIRSRLRKIVSK
jgi:hypothetical protein